MNAVIKLDPNDIRELVEETMREEIRAALIGQLDNVVAGEMAKMKLFKPGSSDLATMITNKVQKACSQAMGSGRLYDVMHRAAVERGRQIAEKEGEKIANDLRSDMRTRMKTAIKNGLNLV